MTFSKLTWKKQVVPHTLDLTATQLRVLDIVFNHTNAEGKKAYPKQATIAETLGMSEKQVGRVLGQLRDRQLIHRTSRGNKRRKESDVYELRLPDIITGHLDSGLPDIDTVITGHPEPDYRTSGVLLPDILDVPLTDPVTTDPDLSDPGLTDPPVEPDIFDVRPHEQDTVGVRPPDPFDNATPSPEARLAVDGREIFAEPVPVSSQPQPINPPSDAVASSDPQSQPTAEGTQMTCKADNDPWGRPSLVPTTQAEIEFVRLMKSKYEPKDTDEHRSATAADDDWGRPSMHTEALF